MNSSSNEVELLHILGVTVHGVEGMSDVAAQKLVGSVLSNVAKAADNGGEASKQFLDAVKHAHNTEIFVTKETCVAYHEDITGSVKINPEVYANYRRYPEGDFRGKIEDFEGILIHEISHGLPKLDFPPVTANSKNAKWNAPEWKENSSPIESGQFARSVAIGHGVAGVVRLLGGTEQFRDEAREELRAVRVANAVMSEVREDYMPRLYYDDPGMGDAKCNTPEGKKNHMQGGGLVTDVIIRAKHLGEHLLNKSGQLGEEESGSKQQGHALKEKLPQNPDAGAGKANETLEKHVRLTNSPGNIAANHVLEVLASYPARPQLANETIRTRIAENQAAAVAKAETYAVDRVDKVEVTQSIQV
jgi:hypothetical protein